MRLIDLVDLITTREVARVCLIEPPYTEAECLTIAQRIAEIESVPTADRTPSEISALNTYKQLTAGPMGSASRMTGYSYKRYDIKPSDFMNPATIEEDLKQCLNMNDPGFSVTKCGDSYVIMQADCPESKMLVSVLIKNATPQTALAELTKLLKTNDIGLSTDSATHFLNQHQNQLKRKINLSVANEPLSLALTRFTEEIGPDFVWRISGRKDRRVLVLRKMNVRTD
ncbi:MAG: hypothetical protein ACAI35_17305 [Candidatus Methylacidiphilales bacterium]